MPLTNRATTDSTRSTHLRAATLGLAFAASLGVTGIRLDTPTTVAAQPEGFLTTSAVSTSQVVSRGVERPPVADLETSYDSLNGTREQKIADAKAHKKRQRAAAKAAAAAAKAAAEKAAADKRAAIIANAKADPQSAAREMIADFGWNESQFGCLVTLWNGESGWRWNADNPHSSAYGIPQALPGSKMSTEGADWATNPVTQIRWGLKYIDRTYGSPCSARSFKSGRGWY